MKGSKRSKAYISNLVGLTTVKSNDKYEIVLNVNNTEVSFRRKDCFITCFNKDCCLHRGRSDDGHDCYHKIAAFEYIYNNKHKLNRILKKEYKDVEINID